MTYNIRFRTIRFDFYNLFDLYSRRFVVPTRVRKLRVRRLARLELLNNMSELVMVNWLYSRLLVTQLELQETAAILAPVARVVVATVPFPVSVFLFLELDCQCFRRMYLKLEEYTLEAVCLYLRTLLAW